MTSAAAEDNDGALDIAVLAADGDRVAVGRWAGEGFEAIGWPDGAADSDGPGVGATDREAADGADEFTPAVAVICIMRLTGPGSVAAAAPPPTRTMVPPIKVAATNFGLRLIPMGPPTSRTGSLKCETGES